MTSDNLPELLTPATLPPPIGYSHIAKVEHVALVFIAGQAARDATGALVGKGDFRAQLEQAFRNLRLAVEAAGGRTSDIIKLNYYCADCVDPSELPTVAIVRDHYIDTERPPISTFVFVRRLVRADWLIEIEAVAALAAAERMRSQTSSSY
jgi:enamine deaminase RidA (YjgF/YER057c/UK114 family)